MKTSTKLLIILFTSIPASLYAYNYLLRQQLQAKNFLVELMPSEEYATTTVKLPKFQHLVIDGTLYYGKDGKGIYWRPGIAVNNYSGDPSYQIQKSIMSLLHYRASNDTLFVSFYKENHPEVLANRSYFGSQELKINAPGIKSVTVNDAALRTDGGFLAKDSFNISVSGRGEYVLSGMVIDKMNIQTKDMTSVNVDAAMNELHYSLSDSSALYVSPKNIKHIYAIKTDPKTQMSISGNATELKKLLK